MSAESSTVARILKPTILILIAVVAIASRLFSIIRFESVIHEFDPWFNYRTTQRESSLQSTLVAEEKQEGLGSSPCCSSLLHPIL
jgi:hypothetical protein